MIKSFFHIILFVLVFFLPASSCKSKNSGNPGSVKETSEEKTGAVVEFSETSHDFGRVAEGEQVGWYFYYKNTGDRDLVILNARASCGCTVADYSRKPLKPGEEASLKVIFDSSGRRGREIKHVTVETNAINSPQDLSLEVEVIEKSNIKPN